MLSNNHTKYYFFYKNITIALIYKPANTNKILKDNKKHKAC